MSLAVSVIECDPFGRRECIGLVVQAENHTTEREDFSYLLVLL